MATVRGEQVLFQGSTSWPVRTVTAAATLTLTDQIVICAGAAPFALTLPTAASCFDTATQTSKVFWVMNPDTDDCTLTAAGAETINGSNTVVLDVQYEWIMIATNGTAWFASV